MVRAEAERVGGRYRLGGAEEFRVVRYGGLMPWLERFGTKR